MMTTKKNATRDLYQEVTDQIIAAIEAGAPRLEMPWRSSCAHSFPVNVQTQNRYRGINILSLWVSQLTRGYSTSIWGTYKQWQACGAQVKKGEKSSLVVFYKELEKEVQDEVSGEIKSQKILIARASSVFNADQVEGYNRAMPDPTTLEDQTVVIERADSFLAATKATILYGRGAAFYASSTDTIHMPERSLFIGTSSSSPTECYYGVLCHELVHWTGAKHRLDRKFNQRFGRQAYAMEELVAELGAAFLCAHLGISQAPRLDHASYLDHWLKVMKADKKAIFTAASKASAAITYLEGLQNLTSNIQAA